MKVFVFLPGDGLLEPFPYGQFDFDVMPQAGQFLQFTELEGADYPVERVGYIQDENAFIGAIWLGGPIKRESLVAIEIAEVEVTNSPEAPLSS